MSSVARRYAKAFFEVAKECDLEKAKNELVELNTVFRATKVDQYLYSPLFDKVKKRTLLNEVFKCNDFLLPTRHFMTLLIDKKRINLFPDIIEYFIQFYNGEKNILAVQCTSAVLLGSKILDTITQKLEKTFSKKIIIETKVDPSIIGGLTLQTESYLYDFSIKNQLETLARRNMYGLTN